MVSCMRHGIRDMGIVSMVFFLMSFGLGQVLMEHSVQLMSNLILLFSICPRVICISFF